MKIATDCEAVEEVQNHQFALPEPVDATVILKQRPYALQNLQAPSGMSILGQNIFSVDQRLGSDPLLSATSGYETRSDWSQNQTLLEAQSDLPTLKYYKELHVLEDTVEFEFRDMSLQDLVELVEHIGSDNVNSLESDPDIYILNAKMTTNLWYLIFSKTDAVDHIEKAIKNAEELLAVTKIESSDYDLQLRNLIVMLIKKSDCTNSTYDLDRAILRTEEMMTITPGHHTDFGDRLWDMVVLNARKSIRMGTIEVFQDAKMLAETLLRSRPTVQNSGFHHYMQRFRDTHDLNDLRSATNEVERFIKATPGDSPSKVGLLGAIVECLVAEHIHAGNFDKFCTTLEKVEVVVRETQKNSELKKTIIQLWVHTLLTQFFQNGDVNHLQTTIEKLAEFLEELPPDDLSRVDFLTYLVYVLVGRYNRGGSFSDLQLVISKCEEIIVLAPATSENAIKALELLSTFLELRFQRTGNSNDRDMALKRDKEASSARAQRHELSEPTLTNPLKLGDIIPKNLDEFNFEEFHEPAQSFGSTVLSAIFKITESNPSKVDPDPNLQTIMTTENLDDLNIAINSLSKYKTLDVLNFLAIAFALRQRAKNKLSIVPGSYEKYLDLLIEAVEHSKASINYRVMGAKFAAEFLLADNMLSEASRIVDVAINLLPSIAPRQLSQQDQQHTLAEFAGLAVEAASLALEIGKDAYHAVKMLELGRGVITGMRLGTRSDLTDLRAHHPALADKFERLRNILDPSPNAQMIVDSLRELNHRHGANVQLNETIQEIRNLPNFQSFLLPPPAEELMAAASLGPVVIINVDRRSDAIVIEQTAIRSIPLPKLHRFEIEKYVEFIRSIRSAYGHSLSSTGTNMIFRMLEWLWDAAVNPILQSLGFLKTPEDSDGENWPRIWWIPTGQLSLLPLHAAGYHSPPSNNTTLDRVISSYSPSVKALLYARQNSRASNISTFGKALLVSMDKTPGSPDLRFAKEEVRMLENILPTAIPKEILTQPCRQAVLDSLNTCQIFHFAGHGESNSSDPSRSALLVNDWQENPLTVEHLSKLDFSKRDPPLLAYLSACSTSNGDVEKLQDETLHLVSACQLAGFQNVVGSLWEVSDSYSVEMAREMYQTIIDGDVIHTDRIALGVHRATRRLRDMAGKSGIIRDNQATFLELPEVEEASEDGESKARCKRRLRPYGWIDKKDIESDPFVWAAYVHFGA
ncbi:hypothetical protein TWF694_006044 [Orbilia ellipsospora]|uniref:CHAT domain-containing protein n=1 Tax=Orbilia ellipsospora TaxID=2528407 RepID=A0AAV9WS35_9PEZI